MTNSKNYVFYGIIIAIAVAIGGFVVLNKTMKTTSASTGNTSQTTLNSNNAVASNQVGYTDSGFSQDFVKVKVGTTVIWTNQSSKSFWVASNPHPTHTDLPGFDSKREIKPGGTYSYTFRTTGSHGYHNHLNPSEGGKVIVE